MDGLKPQNFYYSGGAGMKGILGEDQTKVLAEQLTHIYGKAGATLRAGRVTGAHLNVLGRMLSGQFQDVRVDMTTGGTATAAMGSRFVHIPTVDQLAQTVNVAGVKYAPMQNVTFDRGAGRYGLLTADESLAADLQGLIQKGIPAQSQARRARALTRTVGNWQQHQLQFVRAGVNEAGGALPFYLSKQATIRGGVLFDMAKEVEATVLQSIKAAKSGALESFAGGFGGQMASSYVLQRKAMIQNIALGIAMQTVDMSGQVGGVEKLGQQMFPSVGVKSLKMRGEDIFGNKRAKNGLGRLVVSTIGPNEYGMFDVTKQLRKGIHYLRASTSIPVGVVESLRAHESGAIRTSRMFVSSTDLAAERAAGAHATQFGGSGAQQLWTPMRVGTVVPTAEAGSALHELQSRAIAQAFGDSGVAITSRSSAELAAAPGRTTKKILSTYTGESGTYARSMMHPTIEAEIRKQGVGGYVRFENPLTPDMLSGPNGETGWLGRQMTSTGVEQTRKVNGVAVPDDLVLGEGERVRGMWKSRGKIKFEIERMGEEGIFHGGTAEVLGGKRVGGHFAMKSVHNVDRLVPGVPGFGPDDMSTDNVFQTVGHSAYAKNGEAGIEEMARRIGAKTERNAAGQLSIVLDTSMKIEQHKEAVAKAAAEMGLEMGPSTPKSLGRDSIELLKRMSPQMRRELRKHGKLSEMFGVRFSVMDWGGRAGQPNRGTFGTVQLRSRDQRFLATKLSAMSGHSLDELSPAIARKAFGLNSAAKGNAYAAYANKLSSITKKPRNVLQKGMLLEEYIATGVMPPELKALQASGKIKEMSRAAYTQKFGKVVTGLNHESTIDALKGTSFMNAAGEMDDTWYIINEMGADGLLPATRKAGTRGYGIKQVLVPSGKALKFAKDQRIRLKRAGGDTEGLKMGHQRGAIELHNRLVGGAEPASVYEAHGAMALGMAEKAFQKGGAYHHANITAKASFFGTLSPDATLKPGQVGLSESNTREMLMRQGFTETEAAERLDQLRLNQGKFSRNLTRGSLIEQGFSPDLANKVANVGGESKYLAEEHVRGLIREGTPKIFTPEGAEQFQNTAFEKIQSKRRRLFTHFKREPMRGAYDINAMEIIPQDDTSILKMAGGDVIHSRAKTIGLNPNVAPWLYGDYDYDQGVIANMAERRHTKGAKGLTYEREQRVLRRLAKQDSKYLEAAASEYQANFGAKVLAKAKPQKMIDEYKIAIAEAFDLISTKYGIKMKMEKGLMDLISERGASYALMSQPDVATAAANIRWRQTQGILTDVATTKNIDTFVSKHGIDMSHPEIKEAMETLYKERETIGHMQLTFRTSEYGTLKKEMSAKLLGSAEDFVSLANPKLSTAVLAGGQATGASQKQAALDAISQSIVDISRDSDVNPLNVIIRATGGELTDTARTELAMRQARIAQAGATLARHGVMSISDSVKGAGGTNISEAGMIAQTAGLHGRGLAADAVVMTHNAEGAGLAMVGAFDPERMAREAYEGGTQTVKASMLEYARGAKEKVSQLFHSKWGMPVALALAGATAFGIGRGLFRSSTPAYAPAGSPMPPNPLIQGVREDRMMDYNDLPNESFARVQRVNQVRTHMQVTGGTTYNDISGFTGSADGVYAKAGRIPMHRGQVLDSGGGLSDRAQVQNMIRRRMASDHA